MTLSRRSFLGGMPAAAFVPSVWQSPAPGGPAGATVHPAFPTHDPAMVKEMVGVAHGNVARVRELLASHPALAKAGWDWGFGDWETALGAASHVGNREIAQLLLDHGARPTLFSAAMLGQLDVVRAFVTAVPGVQRTRGPHGLTLMSHARAGGAASAEIVRYLETVGDADIPYASQPLSDSDRVALHGVYVFAAGAMDRFTVRSNARGLTIERAGGSERNLVHVGALTFHPVGAETVSIAFAGEGTGRLTVTDGPFTLTAARGQMENGKW